MRVDPSSVYIEPTGVFLLDRKSGNVSAPQGVRIHWKEGGRWQRLTLIPNEGETLGEVMHRLGDWIAADPEAWTTNLRPVTA